MDTASSVQQPAGGEGARHFGIERHREADGTARLILHGELDLAGQEELRQALMAEQQSGAAVVVVLDQLDYLDSAGIGELVESCDQARADGRRFTVTPGSGNVRRVLWISGVLSRLCAGATEPARDDPRW
jgi:anti-anti-sigma factor